MPDSLTKFKEETKPQKTSAGATTPDNPPTSISYPEASYKYIRNNPIAAITPTTTGVVESFSITPVLPAGMAFDTTTGRIYGTPTTFSAENTYVVTATNSVGSITTNVKISVFTQPAGLRYTSTPKLKLTLADTSSLSVGDTISTEPQNGATVSGTITQILGNIIEVSVVSASMGTPFSPVVSLGRNVDDAAVYAAPLTTVTEFDYTSKVQLTLFPTSAVSAYAINSPVSNSTGALGQVLDISGATILVGSLTNSFATNDLLDNVATFSASEATASAINYVFRSGDAIDLRPVIQDGESITYSIAPSLPAEFNEFDPNIAFIQGTQDGTTSLKFAVTATNPVGSVATSFSIGPFIAPPENLSISNEFVLTVSNNSIFYRGRPISTSSGGKGLVLKRFSDGSNILVRHYEGQFVKDGSVDDALEYGGEEAVIQKTSNANLVVRLASSAGYEDNVGKVATSSTGGQAIISYVDQVNNDVYMKYLSGTFSDTSNSASSTLTVGALTQNIVGVRSSTLRLTATSASNINTRFDKGFHVTSNALAAATVHEIVGSGTTADIVIDVQREGFADGALLDNYSPYVQGEATVSRVAYDHSIYLYTTEKAVLTPDLPKGDNVSYIISPDLPAGLTLNASTGIISGQPTEPSVLKSYTLTAKNITNGILQQTNHTFKMKVYDDFSVVNTLQLANSVALHREGMGFNIASCRLTKDQLQNGRPYARITVPTPNIFSVGEQVSNQFGVYGTVEEVIQDPTITTSETIVVRIMNNGSFSTGQNIDDVYPYASADSSATYVEARSPNKDILCRYEIAENDLWIQGAQYNLKSGKGICNYINYRPFHYLMAPYVKTSTNTVVVVENDNSNGTCTGVDFVFTGSTDDTATFTCYSEYTDSEGNPVNCDDGKYLLRTIDYNDVSGACSRVETITEVSCGGSKKACMAGPVRDLEGFEESGFTSIQTPSSGGLDKEVKMTSPQALDPQRDSNRWLSNYVGNSSCVESLGNPNDALHDGRRYNYADGNWHRLKSNYWIFDTPLTVNGAHSYTRTINVAGGDPSQYFYTGMTVHINGTNYRVVTADATSITLDNRVVQLANGLQIYIPNLGNDPLAAASPFYEIECKDPGFETIGRIRLQVREWDRFFTPEDEIDVLAQLLRADTVDATMGSQSVTENSGGDTNVFSPVLVDGESKRKVRIGNEILDVDFVVNYGATAYDLLQLDSSTVPYATMTGVNMWIRPIKQDASGNDPIGTPYNSYRDWDDLFSSNFTNPADDVTPSYQGCLIGLPGTKTLDATFNFKFPGN